MAVGLKDIAHQTGLAVSTVSNILRGHGDYAAETRDRVRQVAQELGYRPNAMAQAMQQGRFGAVALVLAGEFGFNPVLNRLLGPLCDALDAGGEHLTLCRLPRSGDRPLDPESLPKILRMALVDGMVVNHSRAVTDEVVRLLEALPTPMVWVHRQVAFDAVALDEEACGRGLAEMLLQAGHRHLCWVDWDSLQSGDDRLPERRTDPRAVQRQEAFAAAAAAAGASCRVVLGRPDLWQRRDWFVLAQMLLDHPRRPTAVATRGLTMARALITAGLGRGLRLPGDLSVVSAGVPDDAGIGPQPPLFTFPQAIGATAATMLRARIRGAPPQPAALLAPELVPGVTCGPAA